MAKHVPGISIGIVFHNEQERISKCLTGLLSAYRRYLQVPSPYPVEFIFVDNKSTDRGRQLIEDFCLENALPYTLYISETNNLARSRNKILSLCKYQYLLSVDADCRPGESWLCRYMDLVSEFKNVRWAAIGGENFPPLRENKTLYYCQSLLKKSPLLFLNSTQLLSSEKSLQVLHVPTCNVLYKTEVLQNLGGFDDSFVRVGEDLDLSARLIQNDWKIIFAHGLGVEHFDKTDFKSWFLKSFRYGSVQPQILFSYPKATSRLRWIPFFVIVLLILLPALFFWTAGIGILIAATCIPAFISVIHGRRKNIVPWIFFLNGTIILYCLGYIFGSCKTIWPLSRLQSVKALGEVD
ncbi:MAG TPA: glycosyltransferase [Bdellovibrio sp.]